MYIIDKIIEKAEKSTNDWREGARGNRKIQIQQTDYDRAGRSILNEELIYLSEKNLLKVKWWSKPHDAENITYRLEKLPVFYDMKRNEMEALGDFSFETKLQKIERYRKMIWKELEQEFQQEWIKKYYTWLLQKLDKGELAADLGKLKEYLPVFRAIDQLEEPVVKTEFSEKILKNPKKFQREMEAHVITLFRKYSDEIGRSMSDKEILEYLLIEEDRQEMDIKAIIAAGGVNKHLFHPTEEEYEELLKMYDAVEHPSGTTKEMGDTLENLVKYLFNLCLAFEARGLRTATNQIDCCVNSKMHLKYGIFDIIGGHFFIECKNENKAPSGGVFLKLESIISNTNPLGMTDAVRFGIVISKEKAPETYKKHAVTTWLSNKIVIIAICGEELKKLFEERGNLLDLIEWKIFEVTGNVTSDPSEGEI